jgi:ATP-dependent Clp protease, protease subunit
MAPEAARRHTRRMSEETPAGSPTPLEAERLHARVVDQLLEARTVLIFGEITSELAHATCAQLLALSARSPAPIRVLIHSQGGHVEAGDSIHDVIRFIEPEVSMIGSGWVASAAALIYVAAERERRYALPNTRFLLHQPLGGVRGPASDIEIETAQVLAIRERINRIFARATGQSAERIARDTERNHWLSAQQAIEYGLVGSILQGARELPSASKTS